MIRLLLDQGLPRSAAGILRTDGWDVVHVGDRGLAMLLQRVRPRISLAMSHGAMVTATDRSVRIKRLPVVR